MTGRQAEILRPGPRGTARAAALIRDGRLVAFPTETVYGLGADATNDAAVAAVFAAKDRPSFNPLIVHFTDPEAAARTVRFDDRARRLAAALWPGALTLVLPRRADSPVSLLVSAGLESIAVRIPDHPVAQALLAEAGCPVAAPSANRSGAVSPTTAGHVAHSLGDRVAAIVDGGRCRVGVESTVIDLSGETAILLRPGGVTTEAIEALIGPLAEPGDGSGPVKSPGLVGRHYAPGRPLRPDAGEARPGEVLLAFGPDAPVKALNLSPAGDLEEAAANFFAMVRTLDRPEYRGIAVMPIPESGLGRAINDRLRRASAATAGTGMPADGPIVVFDIEWTTWDGAAARGWSGPGEHREIVQIGAVKLDPDRGLRQTAGFETLVRPVINPELSDYFVDLTNITQARVDAEGIDFPAALAAFAGFVGDDAAAVVSFGNDAEVLEANCRLNAIAFPFATDLFRDVRPAIRKALGMEGRHVISSNLPRLLGFPAPGTAHQAIDDARCVAEALRLLVDRLEW